MSRSPNTPKAPARPRPSRAAIAGAALLAAATTTATPAGAETPPRIEPSFGLRGGPGLINMPTAETLPDGELSISVSHVARNTETALRFQLGPRLSGSFRYSAAGGLKVPGYNADGDFQLLDPMPPTVNANTYYDRSFDLHYVLLHETATRPSLAIGLQDFIGTGVYGAEYIVASKTFGDRLRVTGGLGWGRLGSHGDIGRTGTRPDGMIAEGGVPSYDQWFRGPVAPFGGLAYAASDRLTLKAEYSSDAMGIEVASGVLKRRSSWNFGLDYQLGRDTSIGLFSAHGDTIGAAFTLRGNLRQAPVPGGTEGAPVPVQPRPTGVPRDLGWSFDAARRDTLAGQVSATLAADGLQSRGLALSGTSATLHLENRRFGNTPQALGRAARILSRILPASVEEIRIVPVHNGIPASAVVFQRRDLETLEHAPADALLARTVITDAAAWPVDASADPAERLRWSLSPYLLLGLFDPDDPLRADAGIRARASYAIRPDLVLSGSVRKRLIGNLDSITRESDSVLPRVRTDFAKYARAGDPALEYLTLSHFSRPGRDLYGRVTAGYLEPMYAGVSAELLWKPVDSRLALGIEVNYAAQRAFDQRFGLRDYRVWTGHASAYYAFDNGFHGQLDLGRYLAGDYGVTVALDREFANGWRVGAYATFTDVSFEDFGEGSFDKGIRLTIPLQAAIGRPSRQSQQVLIQPLTRDGGARLDLRDRLYPSLREMHRPDLERAWGRVWR